ncbi:MAG: aminotransferase class V-fold PLP-dependent enzyme, partial [Thermoanaerobaculia bacterium]|nr:aminotransferase class V-fold PLP-dependent enzyme [Thermoanaerobaculia bacterium]
MLVEIADEVEVEAAPRDPAGAPFAALGECQGSQSGWRRQPLLDPREDEIEAPVVGLDRVARSSPGSFAAPWGEANEPGLLRAALRRKRYEAVTIVHNETSTGVVNPVAELARVAREEGDALVLVDAVSSLGGDPVETDDWGLDFVFAGVQ